MLHVVIAHQASLCTGDMWDVAILGSCVLLSAAIAGAHTASADCRLGEKTGAGCDGGEMVQCDTADTVWRAGGSSEDG